MGAAELPMNPAMELAYPGVRALTSSPPPKSNMSDVELPITTEPVLERRVAPVMMVPDPVMLTE